MVASSSSQSSMAVLLCIVLATTADLWVDAQYGSEICRTTHPDTGSEVNCSGNSLTHIPWDLHSNIRILDFSYNKLVKLSNGEFTKYKSVEKLYIRNNMITSIEPNAFSKLTNLRNLDLSSNKLEQVPTDALKLPSLSTLSLQGNSISRIEDGAFKDLSRLKILHLDGNHIISIQKDAFEGLNFLQTLEIQNNALQNLDKGVMEHCGYSLLTLKLYNNPWFCDCRVHWLKSWLENETHSITWEFPSKKPQCDGPSSLRMQAFSDVSLEYFACPPEMYSSSDKVELFPGDTKELLCKYFSMPETRPEWYKNEELILFDGSAKYEIHEEGLYVKTSRLKVVDFQKEDIAKYTCEVKNSRGSDSIVFTVTLVGVDIDTFFTSPMPEPLGASIDMKSVVISVAVVCGLILLIVSIILVVCVSSRYKRNKAMRKQEIRKEIKDHFITNGDLSMKSLDHLDDQESLTNSNNDSNNTKDKLSDQDETNYLTNSLSNINRPSSPNGHTYMSFDSELTDNDELAQIYSAIRSPRHDGSHTESTTPLLDHYAPSSSIYDSREPLETPRLQSFSSVPRQGSNYYWSNNHLPRTPNSIRSNTIYNDPATLRSNTIYNDPNTTRSNTLYSDPNATRSNTLYSDPNTTRSNTLYSDPNTIRSNTIYSDPNTMRSNTIYNDPSYLYGTNPYNRSYGQYGDYRDYRDYRYPTTTPPMPRIYSTKKSASVGNLGVPQRTPAPRKPPRVNRSGERMSDSVDDTNSEIGRTMNHSSFRGISPGITPGITPGTPV